MDMPATPASLPFVKPEDYQYFAPLLKEDEEIEDMTVAAVDAKPASEPSREDACSTAPTITVPRCSRRSHGIRSPPPDAVHETVLPPLVTRFHAPQVEEARERKIMKLLLKVKNGTPPMRKQALRQLTDKAREFGEGPLFNQILPLLMSPTLEDQERHLLVKVPPLAAPATPPSPLSPPPRPVSRPPFSHRRRRGSPRR